MASREPNDFFCSYCIKHLREPYAHCVMCPAQTLLCQQCLAHGVVFGTHERTHSTIIMTLDFPVVEGGFPAAQELDLLNALIRYGPSDWDSVAKYMDCNLTAKQLRDHYFRVFHNSHIMRIKPKCITHRVSSHDPPRFQSSSVLHNAFSGYSAARGEFQTEYDNDAEKDLCVLDLSFIYEHVEGESEEDVKLGSSLFFAVLDGYNRRLKERKRRHEIIRRHGLIQPQKNFLWLRRFDDSVYWGARGGDRLPSSAASVNSQMARTLPKFAQFLDGFEMDKLFEGLKAEEDLKITLNKLYELRRNGVTTFRMALIYKRYCQRREEFLKERRKYISNPIYCMRNSFEGRGGKYANIIGQSRRPAPPLDVSKLPGSDKLNERERELCSVARIVPDSFIEFRNILVAECLKQGGLRLAQARTCIKIDVNKTRKLYDFLIEEGSIYQP